MHAQLMEILREEAPKSKEGEDLGGDDDSRRPPPAIFSARRPPAPPLHGPAHIHLLLGRLLQGLLLLPVPPPYLPRPPRRRRRPRRRPRPQAQEASVRSPAGGRAVPPHRLHHRRPRRGPATGGVSVAQHHAAVHSEQPEQGGDPVRGGGAGVDVPRGASGGGDSAGVRAAGGESPPCPDPRRCRPLQRAPGRRPRSRPRRRPQRPRRPPPHRRRRRQDPRPRPLLPQSSGVGGLCNRDQPQEAIAHLPAMWSRRSTLMSLFFHLSLCWKRGLLWVACSSRLC